MCGAFVSPATLKPSIQRPSMMERHLSAPHGPYNRHLHATDNEGFNRVHTKGPCYWVRDSPPKPEHVHKQYWFLVPSCNAMLARRYHMLVLFIETPASKKWSFGMWLILFQLQQRFGIWNTCQFAAHGARSTIYGTINESLDSLLGVSGALRRFFRGSFSPQCVIGVHEFGAFECRSTISHHNNNYHVHCGIYPSVAPI